jgi:hypothetical protein
MRGSWEFTCQSLPRTIGDVKILVDDFKEWLLAGSGEVSSILAGAANSVPSHGADLPWSSLFQRGKTFKSVKK